MDGNQTGTQDDLRDDWEPIRQQGSSWGFKDVAHVKLVF